LTSDATVNLAAAYIHNATALPQEMTNKGSVSSCDIMMSMKPHLCFEPCSPLCSLFLWSLFCFKLLQEI